MTFLVATFAFNAKAHGSSQSSVRGESGSIGIVAGAFAIAVARRAELETVAPSAEPPAQEASPADASPESSET